MPQSLSPGECVKKIWWFIYTVDKEQQKEWTPNSFNEMNETTRSNHM